MFDYREMIKALAFSALVMIGAMWASETLASPESEARATVVRIVGVPDEQRLQKVCSAVVVAPGVAYTARHCVDEPMFFHDQPLTAAAQNESDFAMVVSPAFVCPCAERSAPPAVDTPVISIGFPSATGGLQFLTRGAYQGRDPRDGQLITTAPLSPGMSGGGTFVIRNGRPYLIGVNSARQDVVSFVDPLP